MTEPLTMVEPMIFRFFLLRAQITRSFNSPFLLSFLNLFILFGCSWDEHPSIRRFSCLPYRASPTLTSSPIVRLLMLSRSSRVEQLLDLYTSSITTLLLYKMLSRRSPRTRLRSLAVWFDEEGRQSRRRPCCAQRRCRSYRPTATI